MEKAVADAIGQSLGSMATCISDFESTFAGKEHHKDWLRALKKAIAESDTCGKCLCKHCS